MIEFEGLRAQDFQRAWPQAYQQALHHVAILHEQAGNQMASATRQIFLAQRIAEKVSAELLAAKDGIVESIDIASQHHLKTIRQVSASLTAQTADLLAKEQAFLQRMIIEKTTLEQSQAQLAQSVKTLRSVSLWRRLLWAVYPASIPPSISHKFATHPGPKDGHH